MSFNPNQQSAVPSETEPEQRLEARALTRLGYGHCLDTDVVLPGGATVQGRNFLDGYGNSPHRQDTEKILQAFELIERDDPNYETLRTYILHFLRPQFGEPQLESDVQPF